MTEAAEMPAHNIAAGQGEGPTAAPVRHPESLSSWTIYTPAYARKLSRWSTRIEHAHQHPKAKALITALRSQHDDWED